MVSIIIFELIVLILETLVGLFPPGFSILFYGILIYFSSILTISKVNRNLKKKPLVILIVSIALIIFNCVVSYEAYNLVHNFNEVKKEMKVEFGNDYKIVGISFKKSIKDDKKNCDFVFDAKLKDDSNITFQVGYCDVGLMWTSYDVIHNYIDNYLSYYYSDYSKNKNVSFEVGKNSNFKYDGVGIIYNNSTKTEVKEFLDYVLSKNDKAKYQLPIYNKDTNECYYIDSWNDSYKDILDIRLDYYME